MVVVVVDEVLVEVVAVLEWVLDVRDERALDRSLLLEVLVVVRHPGKGSICPFA